MTRYPICPVPAPRMSKRDKWSKRPCVQRYKRFREQVQLHRVEIPQPCRVVFCLPMPKSWGPSVRLGEDGARHMTKPDLDNLLKGLLDAVYYKRGNDAHVWSVWAEKRWTDGPGYFYLDEIPRWLRGA